MRRRDLLAGLLVTATAGTLRAAEPKKVFRLAVFTFVTVGPNDMAFGPLLSHLRELGYVEGKNLIVDRYSTEGRPERLGEIARSIARAKPDVIVAAHADLGGYLLLPGGARID